MEINIYKRYLSRYIHHYHCQRTAWAAFSHATHLCCATARRPRSHRSVVLLLDGLLPCLILGYTWQSAPSPHPPQYRTVPPYQTGNKSKRLHLQMSLIQFTVCFTVLITFAELCNWSNQNNSPNSLLSSIPPFATLERERKLGRVGFCKDFWDCSSGQRKKMANSWPTRHPVTIPETPAGRISLCRF